MDLNNDMRFDVLKDAMSGFAHFHTPTLPIVHPTFVNAEADCYTK